MQTANARLVVLSAVVFLGVALSAVLGEPLGPGAPRWPVADSVYSVSPWSMSRLESREGSNRTSQVSRVFRGPAGIAASFSMFTNQAPKLYGAGAEVPFLGDGFTIAPAPHGADGAGPNGVNALVATRGSERWLVLYAYGERRGLLGNGPVAWTLAVLDGLAARPNDYYKLYLIARSDQLDAGSERAVVELADQLFPQIAASYATDAPPGTT